MQGRPLFESSSISDLVPCLQSVGISSCLPLRCPSISFSAGLCSFSQKLPVLAISHRCGWALASRSGQTTNSILFSRKVSTGFFVRLLPDIFISDVVQLVWSYYVQRMGYREIIVTKPYLVSKEAQLYSL